MAKSYKDIRHFKNLQHRDRILRKTPIVHNRLEKGMVIIGNYTPSSKEYQRKGLDQPHEYLLLVLNKNYDGYVHALNLDAFDVSSFDDIADKYGLKYIYYEQKHTILDIPKLKMDLSSRRYYDGVIREYVTDKKPKAYRRMIIKNFNYYQLIDYNFPEEIQYRFLYGLGVDPGNPNTITIDQYVEMSQAQRDYLQAHKFKGIDYNGIPETKEEYVKADITHRMKTSMELKDEIINSMRSGRTDDDTINSMMEQYQDDRDYIKKQSDFLYSDKMKNIKKKK